ncbi:glycosyltransferase family 2 protein [Caldimonas tepidiphila]|uniref:glycosyltransferase family 2 protein n=1 Tax=Caldimonas tepidiphila TaxID=2315841 RepID=UPI000E5B33B5|nr:glycosyltransferase family 2 protein [Caldimonas tepidiphila]
MSAVAVFWSALLVLVYTYVGYPLAIWLLARLRSRPVARAPQHPMVAIVIVAHNEAHRLQSKLQSCLAQDYPAQRLRIVVASDGSTDGTQELIESMGDPRITLLAFPQRRGKAACLNDAVAACREDVIVFNDARQPLNREAVRCLVENLADASVGAASGELVFVDEEFSPFAQGVDAYWRYEKFIRQQEARFGSVVGVTGALYALRRECFRPIPPETILDDVLIPMQAAMQGRRVVFESRAQAYDRPSQSPQQERLRKVRTLAGNFQLLAMRPELLLPWCNPLFLQFVSHKVLRLAAPFLMALLLLANLALLGSGAFYVLAFALQLGFYALPLIGRKWERAGRSRAVRLAGAFLLLNGYVLLGLREFLVNKNAHLWRSKSAAPGSTPAASTAKGKQ